MDLVVALPAFVVAVVLISASPGPAVALVMRRAALRGWRGAVPTVLGLEAGLYLWALAAAAGFAALVAASEVAYVVLRVVGAVVLIVLGVRAWRAAWRLRPSAVRRAGSAEAAAAGGGLAQQSQAAEQAAQSRVEDVAGGAAAAGVASRRRWWGAFAEGALVQLANPKAAVFMLAFYPQFIPADRPLFATTAALALLQVAIETLLYLGLAVAVGSAGAWFRRPVVRRRLEAVTGTVLVGLGVRVAATP